MKTLRALCHMSLWCLGVTPVDCPARSCACKQGKYETIASTVDCCLGWLPSRFISAARWGPEQQCIAVLSLLQLLLVWALPIVLLSRRVLARVPGFL